MIIILVGMTMKNKIAITLDQDLIEFLDDQATNRSEYLNTLLAEQRSKILRQQMIAALQEDLADPDHQAEIAAWDVVIGDGLNAER
jgi:metal-responsive CopG/Arc/MetJ family transcriptional regulator